jgi:hypothetical protein
VSFSSDDAVGTILESLGAESFEIGSAFLSRSGLTMYQVAGTLPRRTGHLNLCWGIATSNHRQGAKQKKILHRFTCFSAKRKVLILLVTVPKVLSVIVGHMSTKS